MVQETDPVLEQLRERLDSLDKNCLTNLDHGLSAVASGDLTVAVHPRTTPITDRADSPEVQALVDLFNSMLGRAESALESYEQARGQLRHGLGDRSCLNDLEARLTSLDSNCLTNLGNGLEAMTRGDLTVDVQPVTAFLETGSGQELGKLGTIFNSMLAKAQGGLGLYNSTRTQLADMIREISGTAGTVSTASVEMASTATETSRAIEEIARAVTGMAEGAQKQAGMVSDAQQVTTEAVALGEQARGVADQGVR